MPILNIYSKSADWRARRLSNFSDDAFMLDGIHLASREGFIQGIKFPYGHPNREQAFAATGGTAKRLGNDAERRQCWWVDGSFPYASPEHRLLIERAIRACVAQNPALLGALLATDGCTLVHHTGDPDPPNSSLPAEVFCAILTRIRNEYFDIAR